MRTAANAKACYNVRLILGVRYRLAHSLINCRSRCRCGIVNSRYSAVLLLVVSQQLV